MTKKIIIILVIVVAVGIIYLAKSINVALSSDSGALSPGTMADDATVGTIAWTNPDNAKVSDNVYAVCDLYNNEVPYGHYLKATNFGFSIPSGATINGILVEIEKKANRTTFGLYDRYVKIVKADGTIGTTNKASATIWSTTEAYISYGSSSDLWGETWDDTKINDVDFGVVIAVESRDDYYDSEASVDHIRITVYYTTSEGTSQQEESAPMWFFNEI